MLAGGNLDNTSDKYQTLFRLLETHIGQIVKKSALYKSKAWGYSSENSFINVAVCMQTKLLPAEILEQTQNIEKLLGRKEKTQGSTYSDRSIDIDILFYNDVIYHTENLIIPHPRIIERKFVLVPLCEIASGLIHPITGKTIQMLNEACEDQSEIALFTF